MQEVFTLAEARALQGKYLIATQDLKDEFDRLSVPVSHSVQVIGLDMYDGHGGIVVQYAGDLSRKLEPRAVFMNKTTYEAHFIVA